MRAEGQPNGGRVLLLGNYLWPVAIEEVGQGPLQQGRFVSVEQAGKKQVSCSSYSAIWDWLSCIGGSPFLAATLWLASRLRAILAGVPDRWKSTAPCGHRPCEIPPPCRTASRTSRPHAAPTATYASDRGSNRWYMYSPRRRIEVRVCHPSPVRAAQCASRPISKGCASSGSVFGGWRWQIE